MNLDSLQQALNLPWARAALTLLVGVGLTRFIARLAREAMAKQARPHHALIAGRLVNYVGTTLALVGAASALGLDVRGLLATAGLLTIAVGLAAQAGLSSLIAGMFLLVDRPFQIGDTIEIQGNLGIVTSMTMLSTHVRTFDNVAVRWPNDIVLKATILNYTRHPARRVDLKIRLPFDVDLDELTVALQAEMETVAQVLLDPAPELVVRSFQDAAIEVEARAWLAPADVLSGRTALVTALQRALKARGIHPVPLSR